MNYELRDMQPEDGAAGFKILKKELQEETQRLIKKFLLGNIGTKIILCL
jgi:hypothetical protein